MREIDFSDHKGKKVYLAIPYSKMPQEAFILANTFAVVLMSYGIYPFSPISHSHPLAVQYPKMCTEHFDQHFWYNQDMQWLKCCDEVWVICAGGWRNSKGVTAEICVAEALGIPVRYLSPIVPEDDLEMLERAEQGR